MPVLSFDDLVDEEVVIFKPKHTDKKPSLSAIFKKAYQDHNGCELEKIGEAQLFIAASELDRYCRKSGVDFQQYAEWAINNFEEVFSPRRLINDKYLSAFLTSQISYDQSELSGFFIIETKEVVDNIYSSDGQILFTVEDGAEVYVNGKKVHVKRL
jgi:hypothetical protein